MRAHIVFGLLLAAVPLAAQEPAQQPVNAVTLEQAIKMAEQVQPNVIQARGSVQNASAQVRAAYGEFIPNLTANSSGGYSYSEVGRPDPITGQVLTGNSSSTSINMGLSASVDLFTGFRRGADIRNAKAQSSAADATLVNARYQTRLNTTQEFLNALAAEQLVTVRQASVARAQEQLKVSVAKLHTGSATRSDSLRSLVTLGNTQVQLIQARAQLAQSEANLGRLIGVDGRVSAKDDSSFYHVVEAIDTTALLEQAQRESPQVRSAEANVGAARAQVSAARAAYWPTLSLNGNYSYSGNKNLDYQLFNQRQVSLRLSWPLFNGFSRERNIVTQETSFDVAQAQATDAARQVQASLIAQLANLDAARLQIDITHTSVQAAEEDLRVQQERYRLGAATIVDVLTSQEALNQAEVDVVNARFSYLRAKAQIEALIGKSL